MDKVICDICGTSFPATEECCPICGCSRDLKLDLEPEGEEEDFLQDSPITSAQKVDGKYKAFNEALSRKDDWDEDEYDEDDEDEDDEDEDEPRRGKTGAVILLTIVIMLLLAVCGFLFVRYLLPNMGGEEPQQTESIPETELPVETTTEPGIPCEQLILMSGASLDLSREGEYRLVNVIVKPEDSTDKLEYYSADETVATVNAEGRVTAIGEGDTVITVICGSQRVECRVFVHYVEETEPPTEETTAPTEAEETEEPTGETQAQETQSVETEPATEATEETQAQLKDVTLKLGKNDFSMGVGYEYTIPLACDLDYDEIEWSTGNANVATIENGVITTHGRGTTQMFARYGDQEVTGWIRVK